MKGELVPEFIEVPATLSIQKMIPKPGVDDQPTIIRIVMDKEGMPFHFVFEVVDPAFLKKVTDILVDGCLELAQNPNNEQFNNTHEIGSDAEAAEVGYETPAGVAEQVAVIVGAAAPSNPAPASGESDTNDGTNGN